MKTYIKPEIVEVRVMADMHLLAGSGGVETNSTPGEEYTPGDVSYSRGGRGFWDEEEEY
jgi:hypothetical protein